ncbi:unnamed protein product [Bursaphelenchus xylophilus]|uniref:(pine wood nematode) hypothetical protein n=1 Tax=Bursaphelenchus xylophilus TaxID=6326 RepID=A0A7I8XD13_BURXY|nr:unnamed protein product [Bursaphelenchus xylophilus]CAG9114116.1 unnamed protein product [Bursaphelenchus xylophilus]
MKESTILFILGVFLFAAPMTDAWCVNWMCTAECNLRYNRSVMKHTFKGTCNHGMCSCYCVTHNQWAPCTGLRAQTS